MKLVNLLENRDDGTPSRGPVSIPVQGTVMRGFDVRVA
jgi:hypothetical protein